MSTNLFTSESKFLERSRTALSNAQLQQGIKQALADYGMAEAEITAGTAIYKTAQATWELNKKEDVETSAASKDYKKSYFDLQATFKKHRNQTLIYFKKKPELLVALGVKGNFPYKYNEFFDKVKQFYGTIEQDVSIQTQVSRIKITAEVVSDCLTKLDVLLSKRANFDKELGESQDATKSKNTALINLMDWMDDFDATAKVALYDSPQLLEVLGIFVRS